MIDNTPAYNLLKTHKLKQTLSRKRVLEVLIERGTALSQAEIEAQLENTENRVTVYRVLKDLENAGVIHRIGSASGKVMFAICNDHCMHEQHHDDHVHFNCQECQKVFCLDTPKIPAFSLPEGYVLKHIQIMAEGICPDCTTIK